MNVYLSYRTISFLGKDLCLYVICWIHSLYSSGPSAALVFTCFFSYFKVTLLSSRDFPTLVQGPANQDVPYVIMSLLKSPLRAEKME